MTRMIPMSEFQKEFQRLVNEAAAGGTVIITRDGQPVAQLVPVPTQSGRNAKTLFGFMKGQIQVHGDIIEPINVEWDALK